MAMTRLTAIGLATGKVVVLRGGAVSMIDVVDSMTEAVVDSEGVGGSMTGEGAEVGVAAEDSGAIGEDSVATGEDVADEVASTEAVAAEGSTGVDTVTGTRGVEIGEGLTKEADFKTGKVLREETTLKIRKLYLIK